MEYRAAAPILSLERIDFLSSPFSPHVNKHWQQTTLNYRAFGAKQ
jgi:hypothetical protein